jgi:hypothetical protein
MSQAGLKRRGDLTLWLDETAVAGWSAPTRSTSGGQPIYSDLAIELVLTLRLVFHLALRHAVALARSILRLLGLDLPVQDFMERPSSTSGLLVLIASVCRQSKISRAMPHTARQ